MQIMGDYKKQKNKRSRLSDFVNTTRTLSSSAFIISLFPIKAKQISTIMSTITPNIIINAAEDIVNLPQSRNDTFNRRWNSAFGAIQNNVNGRYSKAFAVGAAIRYAHPEESRGCQH